MNFSYIKVGAVTPKIQVADVDYNKNAIITAILNANEQGVKALVLPELCLTAATCGDLFYQTSLLDGAKNALLDIIKETSSLDMLIFIGMPIIQNGALYDTAVALCKGQILGVVPKTHFSNASAAKKQFTAATNRNSVIDIGGDSIPFGRELLFCADNNPNLKIAVEFADDLYAVSQQSVASAVAGATLIVSLGAISETVGSAEYTSNLMRTQTKRLACGYILAAAGSGESTTDTVFSGHNIIAENGKILAEQELFNNGLTTTEIDVEALVNERRKNNFGIGVSDTYQTINFEVSLDGVTLTRAYSKTPFVPEQKTELYARIELILKMQAEGLAKRLLHTKAQCAVIGISGGLDSALALLIAVYAKSILPQDVSPDFSVLGITMPCFGTSKRTYNNAKVLCDALKVTLKEIDISEAVAGHLQNIEHNGNKNTAYENAQARERTQVLMDIANITNGIVVGTGDLSELALGWATYNGDHMSMYGVNAGLPKTLIQQIVRYVAKKSDKVLADVLLDIVNTPISPELLPQSDTGATQSTEEIVGAYILHDFFLYYTIRYGFSPSKVLCIAERTFSDQFSKEEIKKWLKKFVYRFFSQQFKRSCLPDGVKIGTVSLSPRGDFCMPSDACSDLWIKELE